MSIHIELEGLEDVAGEAFKAELEMHTEETTDVTAEFEASNTRWYYKELAQD